MLPFNFITLIYLAGDGDTRSGSGAGLLKQVSCLNIQYKISGNHEAGLQAPVTAGVTNSESYLKFSSSFHLKMPGSGATGGGRHAPCTFTMSPCWTASCIPVAS